MIDAPMKQKEQKEKAQEEHYEKTGGIADEGAE